MPIVGVGVDVIEIDRFAASLAQAPAPRRAVLHPAEAAYCSSRAFPPQHFAARFAAKEAVGKALGIGMTRWREVEVVRGRGAPTDRAARPLRRARRAPRRGAHPHLAHPRARLGDGLRDRRGPRDR